MRKTIQQKFTIENITSCFFKLKRRLLDNMIIKVLTLFLIFCPLTDGVCKNPSFNIFDTASSLYDITPKEVLVDDTPNNGESLYNSRNVESISHTVPLLAAFGVSAVYLWNNFLSDHFSPYFKMIYNYFYSSYANRVSVKKIRVNIDNLNKCREESRELSLKLDVLNEKIRALIPGRNNIVGHTTPSLNQGDVKTITQIDLDVIKHDLENTINMLCCVQGIFEDSFNKIETAVVEDFSKKEDADNKGYYQNIIETKLLGNGTTRVLSTDGVCEVFTELSKALNILEHIVGVFLMPVSIDSFPEAKPYLWACCEVGASAFEIGYKKWEDLKDKIDKFVNINKHLQEICGQRPRLEGTLIKVEV